MSNWRIQYLFGGGAEIIGPDDFIRLTMRTTGDGERDKVVAEALMHVLSLHLEPAINPGLHFLEHKRDMARLELPPKNTTRF